MSRKIDRALHGPSWVEVILGAVLSFVLGIVLGAGLLIFRPVVVVKELPKPEARDPKAVYFVEGSRDSSRGRDAAAKRKSFAEGRSVSVIEDELNALAGPAATFAPPPAAKAGAKPPEKPAGAADGMLVTGTPNFRIREGALQVGIPVTLDVLGVTEKVIVQTRGVFAKDGNGFVYQPAEFYMGSLPVQRLPYLAKYARQKFLDAQAIPEDVKASWPKLTNVSIDGNVLNLTMP